MKFGLAAAALISTGLLTGCAGTTMALRSANSASIGGAPPRGAFYNSAAIQAELASGAIAGVLLLGYFAAGTEDERPAWYYGRAGSKPPPMAKDRSIAVRDCSRPMPTPSANLVCR